MRETGGVMELKHILGFGGDLSNFVAAILLAWDPVKRTKVFLKRRADDSLPTDLVFEGDDGNPLPRGEKLERYLVSGETRRSRAGYIFLFIGFGLLLLARSLEVWPGWLACVGL